MTAGIRIRDLLDAATRRLASVSDSPRLDAELLTARAIDLPRSFLHAHPDDTIDSDALARLEATVARRIDGEPLAYICGIKEFWSMDLLVTPATLVPRPETEVLVEQALRLIPRGADYNVVDLGTGSGAIALAIARERPACRIVATDLNDDALTVARENACLLDIPNVEFLQGSWTAPLAGRQFQVVLSNPPYVADDDPALAQLQHEPRSALASGGDGLDDLRQIASSTRDIVAAGGALLLEHGADQADALAAILATSGWRQVRCVDDLAGLPRVTIAQTP